VHVVDPVLPRADAVVVTVHADARTSAELSTVALLLELLAPRHDGRATLNFRPPTAQRLCHAG